MVVRSIAMIAVVVGLVSGCSGAQGAPEPDAGPPALSVSSAPSVTPSTTAPATLDEAARARIPEAARAHTPQGAEAFARFYLEQVNDAWMKPDPELIRPYALESCKTCANYVDTAEWLVAEGAAYDGAPTTLGASVVLPESRSDRVLVRVLQQQEERRILRLDGTAADTVHDQSGELELQVEWHQEAWHLGSVKGVQS
jgi:hypothetical protein